jgi:hypothetical protein
VQVVHIEIPQRRLLGQVREQALASLARQMEDDLPDREVVQVRPLGQGAADRRLGDLEQRCVGVEEGLDVR